MTDWNLFALTTTAGVGIGLRIAVVFKWWCENYVFVSSSAKDSDTEEK